MKRLIRRSVAWVCYAAIEADMASTEITVSVKDTETFAKLLEASFEFFAWYNRTYQQQPSNHSEHPWCKLGKVLDDLSDRGVLEQ